MQEQWKSGSERCCGNCRKWERRNNTLGVCGHDICYPSAIVFPAYNEGENYVRVYTEENKGRDCPCFEARDE